MKSNLVYSLNYMITQHIHFHHKEHRKSTKSGGKLVDKEVGTSAASFLGS
jgi:hypothetical protein